MKKILLFMTFIALLLSSCEQKKATETKETEIKAKKEAFQTTNTSKQFKTKSGKIFIITEEKPSASLSNITITPKGFTEVNNPLKMKESDPFDYALVADVNGDGFDELYVITRGAGSGSYASIYGFSSNKDKSVTPIYIPEISDDDFVKIFNGYMGHDKFYTEENRLFRKYPIYKKEDSNAKPTGGNKIIEYQLKMGESSWILEIKH
ncbi:MAG: hypothetical protein L3J34_02690 [Flavobacteriaceae bacterium]|nr:hypothetical protein [Flavobacteriaceae bacterium]